MTTAAQTRAAGFYFVRMERWVVAEFHGASGDMANCWFIPGELFAREDDEFDEIDERPIQRQP